MDLSFYLAVFLLDLSRGVPETLWSAKWNEPLPLGPLTKTKCAAPNIKGLEGKKLLFHTKPVGVGWG